MQKIIRDVIQKVAHRIGYTIIPTWQVDTFSGLRHLQRLIEHLSIDLVIDVGGNAGQFRDSLRDQVGFKGHIVTFEPVPQLASQLKERAGSDPLWEIQQTALGADVGTAEFNIMANTEFSSFLAPNHSDLEVFSRDNVVASVIDVEVTTLNHALPLLRERLKPRAIYLKLDAQGFEMEILKGSDQVLDGILAFQSEIAFRKIYDGAADYKAIIAFAEAHDLLVSGLFMNNEGSFPFTVDFDCYFVRRDYLQQKSFSQNAGM